MAKYRIREETLNGFKRYYVERKGLLFWHECEGYDPMCKTYRPAKFTSLSAAKEYAQRRKAVEEKIDQPNEKSIKYHEV